MKMEAMIDGCKVVVIKTNVRTKKHIRQLSQVLDAVSHISRWTVDMEDSDHVLRIETTEELLERDVIAMVAQQGFQGQELPD